MTTDQKPAHMISKVERLKEIEGHWSSQGKGIARAPVYQRQQWLISELKSAWEKLEVARTALKEVDDWFERLKKDHDEKLGHGFQEACDNWDSISQEPLDLVPVKQAISQINDGGEG